MRPLAFDHYSYLSDTLSSSPSPRVDLYVVCEVSIAGSWLLRSVCRLFLFLDVLHYVAQVHKVTGLHSLKYYPTGLTLLGRFLLFGALS
jgi:hypothetical protein